jgi:hypothetical protein
MSGESQGREILLTWIRSVHFQSCGLIRCAHAYRVVAEGITRLPHPHRTMFPIKGRQPDVGYNVRVPCALMVHGTWI